jgi:hypothetical protein
MSKNLFGNAIRELKNSNRYNNKKKTNIINKNSIGKEFTDEIDFEKESLNLGQDLICHEETNGKFKMNKLRSSIIDVSKEPYSKMDKNENYRTIKIKKEEIISNNKFKSNFDLSFSSNNNTKKNINNQFEKSSNREIITLNCSNNNNNNNKIFGCCYIKNNQSEKSNENSKLEYSVFVRNLPLNPNEMFIRELFSNCGKIISLYV